MTIQSYGVRNGMSRTSVWRALTELESHGLILIENVFDASGAQVANRYVLID